MPGPISRRRFLKTAAAGTAVTVLAGPFRSGAYAANETLACACIGTGGRGGAHVKAATDAERVVALCDVDDGRLAGAAKQVAKKHPGVKTFTDYRKMFDDAHKTFDVVFVATPDHHHAPASMRAIKHGKHVYTEKPMTWSIWEARRLRDEARKARVATQMGNQGMATETHRRLCETIWAGVIGKVREVHIWTDRAAGWWPQGLDRPAYADPVPGHIHWDEWLGPAPERPFVAKWRQGEAKGKSRAGDAVYLPFVWRGWWDFGTGALGDIACHAMAPAFWALHLGKPTAVEAKHSGSNKEMYPAWSIITYEFPARGEEPPCKLVWYDGGKRPPRPKELEQGRDVGSNGALYVGEKGTIFGHRVIPESRMKDMTEPPKTIPRVPSHHADFFIACRGGRPACSNFDFASNETEAALVGNLAIRAGRRIEWDGEAMRPTNCSDADVLALIRRDYRKGWEL